MEIKLKHYLVIELRQIKRIGNILGRRDRYVTVSTNSNIVIPSPFQGISDNHGRLHPQLSRTGAVLPYHPFGFNHEGIQEKGCTVLLF